MESVYGAASTVQNGMLRLVFSYLQICEYTLSDAWLTLDQLARLCALETLSLARARMIMQYLGMSY